MASCAVVMAPPPSTGTEKDVTTKQRPTQTTSISYRNIEGGLRPPHKGVGRPSAARPLCVTMFLWEMLVVCVGLCFVVTSFSVPVDGGGAMTSAHEAIADAETLAHR